jgi:hypothetical protein
MEYEAQHMVESSQLLRSAAFWQAHFQRAEYQYKEYFALFYGPILFAAGVASILLSGFQVTVAVQETGVAANSTTLLHVALWSSVAIMLCLNCRCSASLSTRLERNEGSLSVAMRGCCGKSAGSLC